MGLDTASDSLPPLVPWLGGRAELFGPSAIEHRFDPRRQAAARFFELARALDRVGWAEPLLRLRPSWVFYDCALVPGALFGFAADAALVPSHLRHRLGVPDDYRGLVPISMLGLIPTVDGFDLVQSLAALELPGLPAHTLALDTLRDGVRALAAAQLTAAILWRSPFLARFAMLGPLCLRTAWTPAHDEASTVTFALDPSWGPAYATWELDIEDEGALKSLQDELEHGADVAVVEVVSERVTLGRR